jgi:hypothetical protein
MANVDIALAAYRGDVEAVRAALAALGRPGSERALAALRGGLGSALIQRACAAARNSRNGAGVIEAVVEHLGGPGAAAVRAVLAEGGHGALHCVTSDICTRPRKDGHRAVLQELLLAYGDAEHRTVLDVLDAMLSEEGAVGGENGEGIPQDSALALLAVRCPSAWVGAGGARADAARALLSAPVRRALALPALCAVSALPPAVAGVVGPWLRAHPWHVFFTPSPAAAGGVLGDGVGAAPGRFGQLIDGRFKITYYQNGFFAINDGPGLREDAPENQARGPGEGGDRLDALCAAAPPHPLLAAALSRRTHAELSGGPAPRPHAGRARRRL